MKHRKVFSVHLCEPDPNPKPTAGCLGRFEPCACALQLGGGGCSVSVAVSRGHKAATPQCVEGSRLDLEGISTVL